MQMDFPNAAGRKPSTALVRMSVRSTLLENLEGNDNFMSYFKMKSELEWRPFQVQASEPKMNGLCHLRTNDFTIDICSCSLRFQGIIKH